MGPRLSLRMAAFVGSAVGCLLAVPLAAQTISGAVRDSTGQALIARVEVSLLDSTGRAVASMRSSDSGAYRLRAPSVGSYRLTARRIGFKSALSPWFALDDPAGAMTYDFVLIALPQALAGVTTEAEGDPVKIHDRFGLDKKNINAFVVTPAQVQEWSAGAHDVTDVIRRIGIPGGLTIREEQTAENYGEPCIQLVGRDRHCMLVIVDNIVTTHLRDLDLSTIEDIVVMRPNEAGLWFGSLSSGDGAVHNPNQRSTAGGVLLIRTKKGAPRDKQPSELYL